MPVAKVYALIATYNRLDTLKKAIEHVLAQTVPPAIIIVVDNNSTDGTKAYLQTFATGGNIHCQYLSTNTGCAGALAAGMRYGLTLPPFDYCWIMDDDTFYAKNALETLLQHMENSPFALLGLQGANIRFGKKIPVQALAGVQEADYVMMDGALVSAAAIRKIGIVDDNYFMMCEDHEYCLRLKKNGLMAGVLKNGLDERLYLGGQSGFSKASLWRGYYSARNHVLILRQYFSMVNLLGYMVLQLKLLVAALFLAPDRFLRVRLRLCGIWHGIKGIGGKTLDPQTLKFKK